MEGNIMLSKKNRIPAAVPTWKRGVAVLFTASLVMTVFPVQSAQARAAAEARKAALEKTDVTPAAPTTPRTAANLLGAFVPVIPMEPNGTGFARILIFNMGSAPTKEGSRTTLTVNGLPEGITIKDATPAPTAGSAGWQCTASSCSWVDAAGAGAQIGVGRTVEALVRLDISSSARVGSVSDSEVEEMIEASVEVSEENDPRRVRMEELSRKFTNVTAAVSIEGDSAAETVETPSYLAITDQPGRARIGMVFSGTDDAGAGDDARWTVRLVNLGGATGPATVTLENLLPSELGLSNLRTAGTNWSCRTEDRSVPECTYTGEIAPGEMGEVLRMRGTVSADAETGKENRWSVSVNGMPPSIPSEGSFTVREPKAVDVGVKMVTPQQVAIPGTDIELHLELANYGGTTRNMVLLEITGIPGLRFREFAEANGENSSGLKSVDAEGEPIPGNVLEQCSTTEQGVRCTVKPLKSGEIYASVMTVRLPRRVESVKNSAVLTAVVSTEGEPAEQAGNNSATLPLVVQPANRPFPTLMPATRNDNGDWVEFGGESLKLKSGSDTEFGYVVRNSGAKAFPKGTVLKFDLLAQETATITPRSGWKCTEAEFDAPQFSEEQRLGAATAARTAGVGFDLNQAASSLEKELMEQVAQQATISPIPNATGTVPGFTCAMTLATALPVGGTTQAAVFSATVGVDAEMSVALWRARVSQPAVKEATPVDTSVIITEVKRGIAPVIETAPVRAGSISTMRVSVINKGELEAEYPTVVLSIPAGLRVNRSTPLPAGWSCVFLAQGIAGGLAVCTSEKLKGAAQSAVAEFQVRASTTRTTPSSVRAIALTNSSRIGLNAFTESEVGVKEPLSVKVLGPETVNDISVPLGGGEPAATRVSMTAQSSADGVTYSWRQLCITEGESGCAAVAPRVKWTKKTGHSGEFVVPRVAAPVDLVLQATVRDNDATAAGTFTVRLLPRPTMKAPPAAGQSLRLWDVRPDAEDGPVPVVPPATPSPLSASGSNGSGSAPSRTVVMRQLGDMVVRGNLFGGSVVVGVRGDALRILAGVSGASNVTWSWTLVNGPDDIVANPEFAASVTGTTRASLNVTIPELATGATSSAKSLTLRVTATSGAVSASDTITVRLVDDRSDLDEAGTDPRGIALDGVLEGIPAVLSPNGSVTIGYAVEDGHTVEWSVVAGGVSVATESSGTVTVTASGRTGTSSVLAEVRDASGAPVDSMVITVVVAASPVFIDVCGELDSGIKQATSSLTGLDLDEELSESPDCSFEQSVSFTDKSLSLGIATISGLSGTLNAEGLFINSGTVTTQVEGPVKSLVVRNLFVPFRPGNSLGPVSGYLTGTISDSVASALQLRGWEISATITINDSSLRSVLISGQKPTTDAGAPVDSAPDTTVEETAPADSDDSPSFAAAGVLGDDGSVLMTAAVNNLDLFGVVTVNGEGTINFPAEGPSEVEIAASLAKPVTIAEGVSLSDAAITITNESIEGEGTLGITRSGLSLDVKTSITLSESEKEFAFDATIPTLDLVDGFSLANARLSGGITHSEEGFAGNLRATSDDMVFGGGIVRVTDPSVALGIDCTGGTASAGESDAEQDIQATEDDNGCSIAFGVSAGIEVGVTDPVTGSLSLEVDSSDGTASLAGSLDSVTLADGVVLNGVDVAVRYRSGRVSFVANGDLTVFDTNVNASVLASTENMVVRAAVSGLAPFGEENIRLVAGEIIIVANYEDGETYSWTPRNDDVAEMLGEQELESGDIKLGAVIGLPSTLSEVDSLTGGVVDLPGTVGLVGEFNFRTGAVSLGATGSSDTFTMSGTLSREDSAAEWVWDVSLETNRSINLIPGFDRLTLDEIAFNLTNKDEDGEIIPVTLTLSGAMTLEVAGTTTLRAGAEVRFAGTDDWSLKVTGTIDGEDGGSWEIIPGLTLPATRITGEVSKVDGVFSAELRIDQTSEWRPVTGLTLRDMFVEIGVDRESGAGWDFTFLLGGKMKIEVGDLVVPELAISGGFDDGVWFLQVDVGDETCRDVPVPASSAGEPASDTTVPADSLDARTENVCERVIEVSDGVEIIDARFRLQYDTAESELSAAISGGLRILGFQIDAEVKLSNRGLFMVAGVKNWELFEGGPTFSELAVIFSTYPTNYTLASGYRTSVPGMDITLIAQMAVPEGIRATVGDVQLEPLKISMRGLLTGNIDLRIGIILPADAWIFRADGYGLRLASVGLQLSIRNFADVTVGIYGEARLLVPNQTDQVPGRIAISFSATGTLSINVSIGLDQDGNSVPWQNVFGIDGLTINFAAFSIGINFASTPIPTPEIGMAVSFQLPRAIRDLVGMEDGIDIEGAFFFSTTRGVCLVVSVGREPAVGDTARTLPKAINMFDGNLVGNYMGLKFAPIGCTIAEKKYDPGISVGFSAAIMGISFTALAKIDIDDLEFQVYANFDAFTIGGLRMKQTYLDLLASGTRPLDSRIIFTGGFALDLPAGTTNIDLTVVAKLGTEPVFAIDGRVDNLVIVPGILEVRRVRVQGLVKPTQLQLFVNLEGDVLLLGAQLNGAFRLDIDSSGVREVSARLNADVRLANNAIGVRGNFDFAYLRGGFPSLRFMGVLSVADRQLVAAEGSFDQYSFSVRARLDLGTVFNGQVEGKVVFCNPDGSIKVQNRAGQPVTGASGDFYFGATANVNVGVATASGAIRLGRSSNTDQAVRENCPVMAPTVATRNADQVLGDATGSALRCAPGLSTTSTVAPPTSPGQTTTTLAPCPSTTVAGSGTTTTTPRAATTTTVRAATTTVRAAGQSLTWFGATPPEAPPVPSNTPGSVVWATAPLLGTLTMTAPAGLVFTEVVFASYGNPVGSGSSWQIGSCNAAVTRQKISETFVGLGTGSIGVNDTVFGEPCPAVGDKRLVVGLRVGLPTAANIPVVRAVWGTIDINAGLNLGPLRGSARLNGSFDTLGNINLAAAGTLNIEPLANVNLTGSYIRAASGNYLANFAFSATVAGLATANFTGFIYNGVYEFTGNGTLNLGPMVRSGGTFRLSNVPGREGLRAFLTFEAGDPRTVYLGSSGEIVYSGSWWYGAFGAGVQTPIGVAWAGLKLGNIRPQPRAVIGTPRYVRGNPLLSTSYTIDYRTDYYSCERIGLPNRVVPVAGDVFCVVPWGAAVDVEASLTVFGQNFGLFGNVSGNRFKFTALAPAWFDAAGADRGETWRMNSLGRWRVFWFFFRDVNVEVWWGGQLTVQNGYPGEPFISFNGNVRVLVQWYWETVVRGAISGSFNPTRLRGRVNVKIGRLPEFGVDANVWPP